MGSALRPPPSSSPSSWQRPWASDAITLGKPPYWIHPALTEVVENALLDLGP
ncbi:hypothetical protein [Streptomyces sp. R33]|uniref:Uncharacterized protein n=1 Tax=Streptomyces sp. R33 TaxID=3238629 RepID=A0AB39XVR2_9ACTN